MDILFTPNTVNVLDTEKSLTFVKNGESLSYGVAELSDILEIKLFNAVIIPIEWSTKYPAKEAIIKNGLGPKEAADLIDENIEQAYVLLFSSADKQNTVPRHSVLDRWKKENVRALLKPEQYIIWTMHDWVALRVEISNDLEVVPKGVAINLERKLQKAKILWDNEK